MRGGPIDLMIGRAYDFVDDDPSGQSYFRRVIFEAISSHVVLVLMCNGRIGHRRIADLLQDAEDGNIIWIT